MAAYKRTDEWSDTWHYRKVVVLPDGSRKRIAGTPSINTKRAAEEAERAHVERTVNPPKPTKERRRMSDVFDKFLSDYVSIANNKESEIAAKRSAIERHLRPALDKLYLDEVRAEHIAELTATLRKTVKARGAGEDDEVIGAKTVKNVLQTLRKCLRWAEDLEWIDKAPKIQMPKVDETEIRFLSGPELAALLDAVASEPQWLVAVLLGADAGLRRGELRALQWTDINEVTNKLVISRSRWRQVETSPKSRKPRSVPITKRLKAALHAIRSSKLRGPYVLSRADGGPYGAEHLHDTIQRLARVAKLDEVGWHTLRHTFCTRLAMGGVAPKTIQELAGHSSLMTTMRYMHVVKGATDSAIALLDSDLPRSGHGPEETFESATEAGEILPFLRVTPSGFEPEFSA